LSVIATPFQPRSAVARHSAPPNANDTGTDRLSATAAVPGFGDLKLDADRRPQFHRNSGGAVDRRLRPNDMRRLRESDLGGRLIAGLVNKWSARVSGFSLSLAICDRLGS
jgi:hypothetical protein